MQAIFESIFSVCYLVGVLFTGILILRNAKGVLLQKLVGCMTVVLGAGDAFHLIPRIIALWGDSMETYAVALGFGKAVTSITMTVFYLILYYVWRTRYQVKRNSALTAAVWCLSIMRIVLCLFPQNRWFDIDSPVIWGIYRNIPFTILGILIIYVFAHKIRQTGDRTLRFMPLAIALSFAFYIPVVLWADKIPAFGMLMIPKTLAYVWIVQMGWRLTRDMKQTESIHN